MKLPAGFLSGSISAGLKSEGALDLTIIVNSGPKSDAAGVFTTNKVKAAPVLWSQQVVDGGAIRAVILNSGGANACTGPQGFADVHLAAEKTAEALNISSSEVAVCSTGLIGEFLPMAKIVSGISSIKSSLSQDGLESSARAIMTTDSQPKIAQTSRYGVEVTGIAKGAGMLAPSLATMLSVVMTDADVSDTDFKGIFSRVADRTFNRLDSDGCTSTNDSVLLLASGASGVTLLDWQLEELLQDVCNSLAHQLVSDAEGRTKIVTIEVVNALSEGDAVHVGRACARNNLLKCALFGGDPNWGRILAAVGTAEAEFDPLDIDVQLNGIWVCKSSAPGESKSDVNLSGEEIRIVIDLKSGSHSATVLTNDLSHEYVHENSAYAS
jgi:glutamate N-acetyltransferase/amino-acid N-acetyltransferase